MKLTTLVLFISAIGFQVQASAPKTVNFYYSNFNSYYSCDYAEAQAKGFLKILGAADIKVKCSGGLPYDPWLSLRADFVVATQGDATASWQPVVIKNRESCDFNERLVKQLAQEFSTRNEKFSGSCWDSQGQFTYTLEVLK